jgi:DNA-binding beta-propeller fold protein YncE
MTKNVCLLVLVLAVAAPVTADSLNCRLVGTCDTPGRALGVAVAGNHAYVADDEAGLRVISVSDPAHPSEVGYYDTPGDAYGVAVAGNYAYVADGFAGLRVISVSDPAHPSEVGYYDTPSHAYGVAVAGNYAYVADVYAGLRVIEFYGGGVEETMNDELGTMNVGPTIVRDVLRLAIDDCRVSNAELLDAAGRKVTELRTGANDVRALAPGVYFVRGAQGQGVTKVVLTR